MILRGTLSPRQGCHSISFIDHTCKSFADDEPGRQPYLRIDCGLGEGPHWEEASNTLRFVDIVKRKVHTVDLNKGSSSHHVLADL